MNQLAVLCMLDAWMVLSLQAMCQTIVSATTVANWTSWSSYLSSKHIKKHIHIQSAWREVWRYDLPRDHERSLLIDILVQSWCHVSTTFVVDLVSSCQDFYFWKKSQEFMSKAPFLWHNISSLIISVIKRNCCRNFFIT